jgi:hypothetical protein
MIKEEACSIPRYESSNSALLFIGAEIKVPEPVCGATDDPFGEHEVDARQHFLLLEEHQHLCPQLQTQRGM